MIPETDLIYVPAPMLHDGFSTLREGVAALRYPYNYIENIVRQNVRYRDYERLHGARAVVNLLIGEAPQIGVDTIQVNRAVAYLKSNPIADYDIQCLPVDKAFTICGHIFADFAELRNCVELTGGARPDPIYGYHSTPLMHDDIDGLHVGMLCEAYPRFDEFDDCDNRTYQNYMFSDKPITQSMLKAFASLPQSSNYCKITEKIPADRLPLVYYVGDYNFIQIATAKEFTARVE